MGTLRVYAATTGDCVAGDQRGAFDAQRRRIEQDFSTGVRFVIDETIGEIRCFHPVALNSKQAFYIVHESEPEPNPLHLIDDVKSLFEGHDDWGIQSELSTGPLLEALSSNDTPQPSDSITLQNQNGDTIQFGAPDYEHAGKLVRATRQRSQSPAIYVVGTTLQIQHIEPNLVAHVSDAYGHIEPISTTAD